MFKLITIFSNEKIFLNKLNSFIFFLIFINNNYLVNIKKKLKKKLKINFFFFFFKITWRGKAYRVRLFKKSNKLTLNFGHSHWYKIFFTKNNITFSKLKRQSYIAIIYDFYNIFNFIKQIHAIRFLNKYTKRGIKLKKFPYIKRFGKISQVNSSLHSF